MERSDLTSIDIEWEIRYCSDYGIIYRNNKYRWKFVTFVPPKHPLRKKRKILMETEADAIQWDKHFRYDTEREKLYQLDGSWPICGMVKLAAQRIALEIRTDKVMLERRKKINFY